MAADHDYSSAGCLFNGWVPAGEVIRVVPAGKVVASEERDTKLRLFDQATERLRVSAKNPERRKQKRGWN